MIGITLFFVGILLLNKITKKVNIKKVLFFVLLFVFITSLIWVLYSKVKPRADQLSLINIAKHLSNGDISDFAKGKYIDIYPFQLGFLLLIELMFKIKESILFLQIVNVLCNLIIVFVLYYITKLLYKNDEINKIVLILLMGCFYLQFFSTLIYGNMPGFMFALLSIMFLLKYLEKRKVRYLFLEIVTIVLSTVLKMNYSIYLIAEAIILFIDVIINKKFKNIIAIVLLFISLLGTNMAIKNFYKIRTNFDIGNGIPKLLWINMGLHENRERPSGWYDGSSVLIFSQNDYDEEESNNVAKKELIKRIEEFKSSPKYMISFFDHKILTQWIEPTHQCIWINIPDNEEYGAITKVTTSLYNRGGKINTIFLGYFKLYQLLVYVMTIVYIIFNRKKHDYQNIILGVVFFGGFIFQIIWEAKSWYTLIFTLILIPYAAHGIYDLRNFLLNKKRKNLLIEEKKKYRNIFLFCYNIK